ncbi:MAG: tetratricopeptide repeat protein [Armatimonadetes bacterium]|nr:tetratricopeptide repeat protein [Armatimonadota bacterium]
MKVKTSTSVSEFYNRGIALFDHGLYAEAISEFQRVLDSDCDKNLPERKLAAWYMGEAYANLGIAQAKMNAYAQAEESLKFALMLHPEYPDLHFQLALIYYNQGLYDNAEAELTKALQINPKYARAMFYLGLARILKGKPEGLNDIKSAVRLEPAYCDERYREALELYNHGKHNQAIQLLEEVAKTDIDEIEYHLEKGLALMNKQMYLEAADAFLQAISICPQYADLRNYLGICYLKQGLADLAIVQFRKALDINPRFIGARLNLAAAYDAVGDRDLCISELENVLAIDPENPEAERRIAKLKGCAKA